MSDTNIPFLVLQENKVVGLSNDERKPMFENKMTKKVGLMATCNSCDRIIFEDEKWKSQYKKNGGYCKQCQNEFVTN